MSDVPIIVRLFRPQPYDGPWLLWRPPDTIDVVNEATPAMKAMDGRSGHFEAQLRGEGWAILRQVNDQDW